MKLKIFGVILLTALMLFMTSEEVKAEDDLGLNTPQDALAIDSTHNTSQGGSNLITFNVTTITEASNISNLSLWLQEGSSPTTGTGYNILWHRNQTLATGLNTVLTNNTQYQFNITLPDGNWTFGIEQCAHIVAVTNCNFTYFKSAGLWSNPAGVSKFNTMNGTLWVDSIAPNVTLWDFAFTTVNTNWLQINYTQFNFTIVDENIAHCMLYLTNRTGSIVDPATGEDSGDSWNRTNFNRTIEWNLGAIPKDNWTIFMSNFTTTADNDRYVDMILGTTVGQAYSTGIWCNDSAGNEAWSNNVSFGVDLLDPVCPLLFWPNNHTAFNITQHSSDPFPLFTWNASEDTDLNFITYDLELSDTQVFTYANFTYSNSTEGVATTADGGYGTVRPSSALPAYDNISFTWYWRMNVTDSSGRSNVSCQHYDEPTNIGPTSYRVDTHCSTFSESVYNLCGIVRWGRMNVTKLVPDGVVDLGTISTEIRDANQNPTATIIAYYNGSKEFETFTAGSSTNYYTNVSLNDVVFIYTNATSYWGGNENNETARTWFGANAWGGFFDNTNGQVNITNDTANGGAWNLIPIYNHSGVSFNDILKVWDGNYTGLADWIAAENMNMSAGNFTYFSWYVNDNETGSKFVPFVYDVSFNNATKMQFGEVFWVWLNGLESRFNRTVNLTNGAGIGI